MSEKNGIVVFNPIEELIGKAREAVESATFDYEKPKDNQAARSLVAKVRKLKKPLNEAHKVAKAEALEVCKTLDAMKRGYLDEIENIIEVHAAPLRDIDEREAKRIEGLKAEKEAAEQEEAERLEEQKKDQEAKAGELQMRENNIARKEREKIIAEEAAKRAEKEAAWKAEQAINAERERADSAIREAQETAKREADAKEKAEQVKREAKEMRAANADHRAAILVQVAEDINDILDDEEKARIIAEAIELGYIKNVEMCF